MSNTPASTARRAVGPVSRNDSRQSRASPATSDSDAQRAPARGQSPDPLDVWASSTKKTPKLTPARAAYAIAGADRVRSGSTGAAVRVSSTTDTRATITPTKPGPVSRSPRARPTVTGSAAAAAAEVGADPNDHARVKGAVDAPPFLPGADLFCSAATAR
jgi:hypothetical protein